MIIGEVPDFDEFEKDALQVSKFSRARNVGYTLFVLTLIILLIEASVGAAIFNNRSGLSYIPRRNDTCPEDDANPCTPSRTNWWIDAFKLSWMIFCTLGTTTLIIGTRAVAIWRQFFPVPKRNTHHPILDIVDVVHTEPELGYLGKGIYYILFWPMFRLSGIFVSLSAYLAGQTLGKIYYEEIRALLRLMLPNLINDGPVSDFATSVVIHAFGVALAKYTNNFSTNQKDAAHNTWKTAGLIENAFYSLLQRRVNLDTVKKHKKALAITLGVTVVALLSVAPSGRFSTAASLPKLPLLGPWLSNEGVQDISTVSMVTNVIMIIFTNSVAAFEKYSNQPATERYRREDLLWWEALYISVMNIAAIGDMGSTFAQSFAGAARWAHDKEYDVTTWYFRLGAIISSAAYAELNRRYSVAIAERILEFAHRSKHHRPYIPVAKDLPPSTVVIEELLVDGSASTLALDALPSIEAAHMLVVVDSPAAAFSTGSSPTHRARTGSLLSNSSTLFGGGRTPSPATMRRNDSLGIFLKRDESGTDLADAALRLDFHPV